MRCQVCNRPSPGVLCIQHMITHLYIEDQDIIIKKNSRRMSKPQKFIIRTLMNEGYRVLFEVYFPWAKRRKENVRMPFDIWLPRENLIIEYDGKQHFEFTKFFHKTKENFLKYKANDKFKEDMAKLYDMRVVRFRYDEPLLSLDILKKIRGDK